MSILKNKLKDKFTTLPNELITDKRISFGARILYCYMIGKPNEWIILNTDIITSLEISKDTIAKYFKELLDTGWIERERITNEKGHFTGGYDYIIHEKPVLVKSPNSEKVLIRKNIEDNNNTKTTINTKTTNNTNRVFQKPTAEQINSYCKEIGVSIDANYFIDFYEARGWLISGKTKMKDWKAAIRNWARRNGQTIKTKKQEQDKQEPIFKFEQKSLTEEEKKELANMLKD